MGVKGGQVRILNFFKLVVLSLREDGRRGNLKNKGSGGQPRFKWRNDVPPLCAPVYIPRSTKTQLRLLRGFLAPERQSLHSQKILLAG